MTESADYLAIRELFDVYALRSATSTLSSKLDESWYFAERNLIVDWTETRTQET